DMIHSHSEDERLASRPVAPDQRMLTHAPSPRPLAPGFRFAPGRQFLWGGRWVRGTIRGLEAVDHAQGFAVLALRIGKIVVCRVRVAELGIPSLRRKTARGEHRRLRRRPVVEEPVDVPRDRRLQVLSPGRILVRVERDLVDRLLGTVRPHRPHRDDPAEVLAEGDLFFVAETDTGEQQHAIALERIEAFVCEGAVEGLRTTHRGLCTDPRRQRDKAAAHSPVPPISSTQPSGIAFTPWRAKIASISRMSSSASGDPSAPTLSSTPPTVRQPTSAVLTIGFEIAQRSASCGRLRPCRAASPFSSSTTRRFRGKRSGPKSVSKSLIGPILSARARQSSEPKSVFSVNVPVRRP